MTTRKPLVGKFKLGDRVYDIFYAATGTVVGVPPIPPEIDVLHMYANDTEPWALVEWDYSSGDHYWVRQSHLQPLTIS
jgi:hypothetical protein